MLRKALFVVALGLLAVGLGVWLAGVRGAAPLVIWGAVLLVALFIERWRYRPSGGSRSSAWQLTSERFIDPETGRPMLVYYNPRTGERRYEWAQPEDRPAP